MSPQFSRVLSPVVVRRLEAAVLEALNAPGSANDNSSVCELLVAMLGAVILAEPETAEARAEECAALLMTVIERSKAM